LLQIHKVYDYILPEVTILPNGKLQVQIEPNAITVQNAEVATASNPVTGENSVRLTGSGLKKLLLVELLQMHKADIQGAFPSDEEKIQIQKAFAVFNSRLWE
jgi:hypothetical protein